jgi:hypothetical protein
MMSYELFWLSTLDENSGVFVFSSTAEERFGFGCLILKQTPSGVLLDLKIMIEIERHFSIFFERVRL